MHQYLILDVAGNPYSWASHRQAIQMMASGRVLAGLGEKEFVYLGGTNRVSQCRTRMTVNSILLSKERVIESRYAKDYEPPFSNQAMFVRDKFTCMYCGNAYAAQHLTRDHVVPRSRSNDNNWSNSVTSCRKCNHAKGNRTPEEWGKLLLAVPYTPNWAEHMYLRNSKRIIADQMEFLRASFPKQSPLL